MSNLTLEEVLTLGIIVHAQGVNAQMDDARQKANHHEGNMDGCFYSTELHILESSITWMHDAFKLWEAAKLQKGKEYAGLTLAEFVAQSRPK